MKKLFLLSILIFQFAFIQSQSKLGNEWIIGSGWGHRMQFASNGIITKDNPIIYSYFKGGNSNICDTTGNLILASDGYDIYDGLGNYLEGGDTLVPKYHYEQKNGVSFYSQTSIFLPMDSGKYYFITPAFSDAKYLACQNGASCFFDLLLYNVIDMNANGGVGKVVRRMVSLIENGELSKTQMMACKHANGKDWWLLKQGGDSNIVFKFLFTQDSVYDYGRQVFSAPLFGKWDLQGQSVFSPDGSQYATTVYSLDNPGKVCIFDFDRCYGNLSNLRVLQTPAIVFPPDPTKEDNATNGVAYSANGRFLYVSMQYNIHQYDLQDDTWYYVSGMDTTYPLQFQQYTTLYRGPDDKIYIGNRNGFSQQMSVIDNPDVKGVGCNFCRKCLRLDSLVNGYVGTPPCMPNYSLGSKMCYPDGLTQYTPAPMSPLEVYPNPSSTMFYIKNREGKQKQLVNMVGEVLHITLKDEMDISTFSTGIYFIKCEGQSRKVIIE